MLLRIDPHGNVMCLYGEALDLTRLGKLSLRRASHVEPDEEGQWWADLAPAGGPRLGPFDKRSQALAAETDWLHCHVIFGELPPAEASSPSGI
jgi:hypothetical protein